MRAQVLPSRQLASPATQRRAVLPHTQHTTLCSPHLGSQHAAGRAAWGCTTPGRPARMLVRVAETTVVDSKVSDTVDTGTQAEQTNEQFCWTKHWYPVASLLELDPSRPTQITLLGEDYVLWRDGSGAWKAFADRCPHRLAPLSEGRVEKDGTLLCAYHAWRFDGSGACTAIPQAQDAEHELQARQNPRACATAFPTRVEQGAVWIWPEAGPTAELESSLTPIKHIPDTQREDADGNVRAAAWRTHELPYSADFFFENVLDPAHVVVSHHGIIGNRYTDAKPVTMNVTKPLSKDGYEITIPPSRPDGPNAHSTTKFIPPNQVLIESYNKDGSKLTLGLYCYPTRPGYCKNIGRQVFTKNNKGKWPPGISIFGSDKIPLWLVHLLGNSFLIQDTVFLHWQERITAQKQFRDKSPEDNYYMPISSDKGVILMRKWFERYSPEGIPYKGEFEGQRDTAAVRDINRLFDTWHGHTKHCKACQDGLASLKKARVVTWVVCALAALQAAAVSAAAAGAAAASAASTAAPFVIPPLAAWVWAGLAVAAAGLAMLMSKMISLFHTWPFSHADNH